MTDLPSPRSRIILDCIYYAVAIFFFLYLFAYFWTSEGGPTLRVCRAADGYELATVEGFESARGLGARGTVDGHDVVVGRRRFLAEQGYGYVIKDADDLLGPAI